jgi:hypothetical protein
MSARFHFIERVSGNVPLYLYNCEFPLKAAMLKQRELAFGFPIWHRIPATDEFVVTQEAGCILLLNQQLWLDLPRPAFGTTPEH